MNRTNIEWVKNPDGSQGYTWNPLSGCLNHDNGLCKGGGFPCYAYKLANGRLKPLYLGNPNVANYADQAEKKVDQLFDPFYPRFWEGRMKEMMDRYTQLQTCITHPPQRGVFVCDMGDLFGIGIPEEWTWQVIDAIRWNGYDRFYLLTKQPQNLIKFSPFPENAWVGVTVTNSSMFDEACYRLSEIQARVKYLSIEPYLSRILPDSINRLLAWAGINWLIIGACTGTVKEMSRLFDKYPHLTPMQSGNKWTAQPKIEWVREIVEAADKAGAKVFLKDNLKSLFQSNPEPNWWAVSNTQDSWLRQELPG